MPSSRHRALTKIHFSTFSLHLQGHLNRAKQQLKSTILMNLESRLVQFEDIGRCGNSLFICSPLVQMFGHYAPSQYIKLVHTTIYQYIQLVHTTSTSNQYIQIVHTTSSYNQYIQLVHTTSSYNQYIQLLHTTYTFNQYK